jgi:uncharacterized delta-60 repeat protein
MPYNSTPHGNILCIPDIPSLKQTCLFCICLLTCLSAVSQSGALYKPFGNQGVTLTALNGAEPGYVTGWTKIHRQTSGNLITIASYSSEYPYIISSFSSSGKLNNGFGNSGFIKLQLPAFPWLKFLGMVVTQDDKILTGFSIVKDGKEKFLFRRFDKHGKPDHRFGNGGTLITLHGFPMDFLATAQVYQQPDGKILVAASFNREYDGSDNFTDYADVIIARFHQDGNLDYSFSRNGLLGIDHNKLENYPVTLQVQKDGKILLAMTSGFLENSTLVLTRIDKFGNPDKYFGTGGKKEVSFGLFRTYLRSMVIQPDGKILLCGETSPHEYYNSIGLARLMTNGQFDRSFGDNGVKMHFYKEGELSSQTRTMVLQDNGNIWIVGAIYRHDNDDYRRVIICLDKSGRLNKGFATNGVLEVPETFGYVYSGVIADNQLIVGGERGLPFQRALLASYDLRTSTVCPDELTSVAPPAGIQKFAPTQRAYPNPASQQVSFTVPVESLAQTAKYTLFDRSGVLVKQGLVTSSNTTIAVGSLANGLYELVIWDKSGSRWNEKIIVQH